MDEQNGEVFDHHAELFSQIGAVSDHESFKDFILDSSGLFDSAGDSKLNSLPLSEPDTVSGGSMWNHSFSEPTSLLLNHSRAMYNNPIPIQPLEEMDTATSLIDSLVKTMPASDGMMDQLSSQHFIEKNFNIRQFSHTPGQLFDGVHRINTDKVTQEVLDSLNSNLVGKCNEFESLSWNGVMGEQIHSVNFHSQNRTLLHPQSSLDKNGNSAVYNNTHADKLHCAFPANLAEHIPQSNSLIRLSPSASVESNIHTPTASYESASPLSSNRTPIRSDESISPMGSGHTPMRMDDSTSPLASVKTPIRLEEGSPMGRTPLRIDEGYSPAGISGALSKIDGSPSQKQNGHTPQRFENYSSPPSVIRKAEVKSPSSYVLPSPKTDVNIDNSNKVIDIVEDVEIKNKERIPLEKELETLETPDYEYPCEGIKKPKDDYNAESNLSEEEQKSVTPSADVLSKNHGLKKSPIPIIGARRVDDTFVHRQAAKRTLPRKSDSELFIASSSLSKKSECESDTIMTNEFGDIKTENEVPDLNEESSSDSAQKLGDVGDTSAYKDSPAKSRKRKKLDIICVPNAKRRFRKKVTYYQSSVSTEEAGIKLKIKLAPPFPQHKTLKKRRNKRQYISDDEESGIANKKSKKCVRFSAGAKETGNGEQTDWGCKIPPDVLQRIFKFVIEDQGCVPSLVRFSSVCKLWNLVASRSELWQNIDLSSPYIKQKCRIDRYFRWLLENRLESIHDLNLSGWKFSNIPMILSLIGTHCTEIESIGLGGWQGLHYEHIKALLQDCPHLAKLDLSDVSPESKSANSAVSQKSITYLTQTMGDRLTQLILAHNTLTCLPQIISSLATHCPNLQVLDLSNIRRVSHTEFALNIEHLQEGCQKLRVLRITNSCITLANVPLEKQVASPGFKNLEELSIAGHQGTESLRITSVIDDNCLERILKTSHKLKLLDVRGCTRITDSSLVRVPAWDIQHLFLSGCYVTRQSGSGLELIAQKWSHSLMEIDLAWTTVTEDLNAAIMAFAEKGSESPLRIMNLCGSSVTLEPVKAVLTKCPNLESLNLQSCRGLPRGVKRLYENEQLIELRNMLEKKDRDSISESEERKESDREGKESPGWSTNNETIDFVT